MKFKALSENQLGVVTEGIVRGEYHLLLGAGASLGAMGGDGQPLPNAADFAQQLVEDFGLETNGEPVDLRQAYELAEDLRDRKRRDRSQYLRERFSGCQPSWHRAILPIRWRRIWNLNIDDVIERAYELNTDLACQSPKSYNWSLPYREPERELGEVQIVHLHGFAQELESMKESNIVFSILEYLQATSSRYAWHRVFGDEFLQFPFIVVGTKLSDEYDLAEVLRRGNRSQDFTGRPSIIVLRHISPIQRQQFTKWGLVPIQAEAETFFSDLAERLKKAEKEQAAVIPGLPTELLPTEARVFLQQFQSLRTEAKVIEPRYHDFYGGEDPIWADIINSRDARFEIIDRVLSSMDISSKAPEVMSRQQVHCIWGPPFCGKSTALLRIGQEMISEGFDVFKFRGEERLDVEAAFWWVTRSPRCVLLFDGLADYSEEIGKLCESCNSGKVNLILVGVERERRLVEIVENIDRAFLMADDNHKMELLSDTDIDRLLDKLRGQRRLGKLTDVSSDQQTRYFRKESRRQLFAGMADLEKAKGFTIRATDEYQGVKDKLCQALYAVTCMSYTIGYPLPAGIACSAVGMSSTDLHSALITTGELSGIVLFESKGLRSRHRVLASLVIHNALNRNERYQLSVSLAKALAPYVTTDAIARSTFPYRIIRQLMDEQLVYDWVGRNFVSEWYNALIQHYDWNARFWEQRALVETRLGHYPKARSFAEEAVRIHRDPFTLNTLGTIMLRMGVEYHVPGSATSKELIWDGIEQLRESRRLGAGRFIHPYNTFFSYILRFAQAAFKDEPVDSRLANEWQHWMKEAELVRAFGHPELHNQLQQFKYRWLSLAVTQNSEVQDTD